MTPFKMAAEIFRNLAVIQVLAFYSYPYFLFQAYERFFVLLWMKDYRVL